MWNDDILMPPQSYSHKGTWWQAKLSNWLITYDYLLLFIYYNLLSISCLLYSNRSPFFPFIPFTIILIISNLPLFIYIYFSFLLSGDRSVEAMEAFIREKGSAVSKTRPTPAAAKEEL